MKCYSTAYFRHRSLRNDIGGRIKICRKAHDLTQKALAKLLNVHHNTVMRWEKGRERPVENVLELLI